jgi:hypothetical protein
MFLCADTNVLFHKTEQLFDLLEDAADGTWFMNCVLWNQGNPPFYNVALGLKYPHRTGVSF